LNSDEQKFAHQNILAKILYGVTFNRRDACVFSEALKCPLNEPRLL
jgi:hypothetical protein